MERLTGQRVMINTRIKAKITDTTIATIVPPLRLLPESLGGPFIMTYGCLCIITMNKIYVQLINKKKRLTSCCGA